MPRGAHKVKPAKTSSTPSVPGAAKPPRTATEAWRAGLRSATFLSRVTSEGKNSTPLAEQPVQTPAVLQPPSMPESCPVAVPPPALHVVTNGLPSEIQLEPVQAQCEIAEEDTTGTVPQIVEPSNRPSTARNLSSDSTGKDSAYESDPDRFDNLKVEDTQSSASSLYSRDSASIYSSDSASIYSSASSIYSSAASVYSFEGDDVAGSLPRRINSGQRSRSGQIRRDEPQDAAARERNSLARKAAMFKNSRLQPDLPTFKVPLATWSMICRAGQASIDCYDSQKSTRRGTYTPADTSKDIKAMIIDDQKLDDGRLVVVAIRGTEQKSLTDWSVNKASNPVSPTGFFDDEENHCHAGFLQVTKAMVPQVSSQLQALCCGDDLESPKPSLLFTGHSAGGAIAAMLYSHMLSTRVSSSLTPLAPSFSSVNCITFGAPPVAQSPLPCRNDVHPGLFLSVTNEGDPVVRLSHSSYVSSLAKLMTASSPSALSAPGATPVVKVVRRSRGTAVVRQTVVNVAPPTPWAELPLWPTPAPVLVQAGDVVLMREDHPAFASGASVGASASFVTEEHLREVMFADLSMHGTDVYMRRVRELALGAMMGR